MGVYVFVSYRRADVGGYAGRLNDALIDRLGADKVFQDVAVIGPGRDFTKVVDDALTKSDAVLAVIGPGWLNASSSDGERRLLQSGDFVRIELVKGLASGVPVVPVLVGGATMPTVPELPPDLSGLVDRQSVTIRDEAFHHDVNRLISLLREGPTRSHRHRARWIAIPIALVVIAAGALLWTVQARQDGDQSHSTRPARCPDLSAAGWSVVDVAGEPSTRLSDTAGSITITITAARFRETRSGTWLLALKGQMENDSSESRYLDESYYRTAEVAKRAFEPVTCSDFANEPTLPGQIADGWVGFSVHCLPDRSVAVILQSSSTTQRARLALTSGIPSSDCLTSAER